MKNISWNMKLQKSQNKKQFLPCNDLVNAKENSVKIDENSVTGKYVPLTLSELYICTSAVYLMPINLIQLTPEP